MDKDDFLQKFKKRNSKKLRKNLNSLKIAIAGAGGIGSNLAIYLARAGITNLHIIDYDRVEISNLNRQHYFIDDVGKYKVDAIKSHLLKVNPYISVTTEIIKITKDNILEIFKDYDLICEAFDDEKSKSMLVDEILSNFSDKFVISTSGMSGNIIDENFKIRKFGNRLFVCGDLKDENLEISGLMAPKVSACAALCASVALEILLSK
ncbi:sulfur carrier protein ThiS adenylyltransferase ThiF [Campylobacter corcagiensis]|uniref:Sulfur carrier protein ThiS adenylyltransferase ThiF n=1 Tax=Campylobacter corcagiensis TaxID=1448857 RepID=A0A7M1LFG0_9BACT|nr:sulfur carrier protein ThiS adenylyltransferase ThiF [Campylobacter corcagiensis]QKF64776.1 ThiS adenylyltransferase [Campylobacter corcagiensis]QOQ87061.1 sulfur carrier protein ThiS adenylyltransferase ThiF [Campylobacter corcagiensis]